MKKLFLLLLLLLALAAPALAINTYEASLSSSATSTGTVFSPTDGEFHIDINGSTGWTGSIQIEGRRNTDSAFQSVGSPFTSNAWINVTHSGGAQYHYRAKGTITSGTVTVRMTQK